MCHENLLCVICPIVHKTRLFIVPAFAILYCVVHWCVFEKLGDLGDLVPW